MTAIQDWLNANAPQLECDFYAGIYYGSFSAALASAYTGQPWLAAGLGGVAYAAEWTAKQAGCFYNEPAPPQGPIGEEYKREEDCWKTSEVGELYVFEGTSAIGTDPEGWTKIGPAVEVVSVWQNPDANVGGTSPTSIEWIAAPGGEVQTFSGIAPIGQPYAQIRNAPCIDDEPEYTYPDPIGPTKDIDTQDGCTWTAVPIDAFVDEQGRFRVYYEIKPDRPECGDPIGFWSDGTGGGDTVNPVPPTTPDGPSQPPPPPPGQREPCPDPCPEPGSDATLPGVTYQLTGVCESVPDGDPQPQFEYSTSGGPYYAELAARIDRLAEMLNQHLSLRTPTCSATKPALRGTWISTNWVSDSPSAGGTTPLRKLFRYRSESTRDTKQLQQYWDGFTWQAGPVIVKHVGAWWGNLQVWAASEAEGKRIIRFAAGEAGIDPDLDGQWLVGGSRSARYGMTGTMRLAKYRGLNWTTRRDGADGPPEL